MAGSSCPTSYASSAAVASLITRRTENPASFAAALNSIKQHCELRQRKLNYYSRYMLVRKQGEIKLALSSYSHKSLSSVLSVMGGNCNDGIVAVLRFAVTLRNI